MPDRFPYPWLILGGIVLGALTADILIFHRRPREVRLKEALAETAGWVSLALAFDVWIYHLRGQEAALQFFTAYLVEKSLSADNILIFILIFSSLGVPAKSQHKVLFYGVAGALVMRALFVFAGIELLQKFHAVLFIFGALLLVTAVRMLTPRRAARLEQNRLIRMLRWLGPSSEHYEGDSFWVVEQGRRKATALFLALVTIETVDVIFAADSVPAVLAITRDPFLAYSSNLFAVLGLRALYFALSDVLSRLRYLHQGLALILIFVAAKMMAGERLPLSTAASLGVIGAILLVTVIASIAPSGPKNP